MSYELARVEGGFEVIMERGHPLRGRAGIDPALAARLAGELTAERLRTVIDAWLRGAGAQRARVCLQLV